MSTIKELTSVNIEWKIYSIQQLIKWLKNLKPLVIVSNNLLGSSTDFSGYVGKMIIFVNLKY